MKKRCAAPACERPTKVRGYCGGHWHRVQRGADLQTPLRQRIVAKVDKPQQCTRPECDRAYHVAGLCLMHYHRKRRGSSMDEPHKRKARRGQRAVGKDGYVSIYLPDHPNARHDGWIFEHRAAMEQKLGRPLWPDENVHHKNGVRGDNRIANLELWARAQPSGQRAVDLLAWAKTIVARYDGVDLG